VSRSLCLALCCPAALCCFALDSRLCQTRIISLTRATSYLLSCASFRQYPADFRDFQALGDLGDFRDFRQALGESDKLSDKLSENIRQTSDGLPQTLWQTSANSLAESQRIPGRLCRLSDNLPADFQTLADFSRLSAESKQNSLANLP
jgi:hypothetical protein